MNDIDKLFEKMSREAANSMNGTHPPVPEKEQLTPKDYDRWGRTCIKVVSKPPQEKENSQNSKCDEPLPEK